MIKFLYSNPFDSATITALNTAGSAYAAANVQNRFLKKTYRSTGISNQWLKFDLGSAQTVTLFTFFANNLTTSATVKLYGHTSDLGNTEAAWASASYQGTISNFDQRAGAIVLNQSLRWWLFAISDASNSNGYVEIGRVYAGQSVSPTENFNENFNETFIDPSEQLWTVGGHAYSVQRERYKVFEFQFMDLVTANQTILRNLFASVFKTEPFVIAMDTDGEPINLTRYVMLQSDLQFNWSPYNRASCAMTMRELR